MPLLIRREDTGAVILRLADRITRLVGSTIITGTGSLTIPTAEGTPWFYTRYPDAYPNGLGSSVTLNGRTISWSGLQAGVTLTYGVY